MRRLSRLFVGLCGLAFGTMPMSAASAAPAPLEAFGSLPKASFVSVSPSGRYVSSVQQAGDQTVIAIQDTTTGKWVRLIKVGERGVTSLRWLSEDRIMVQVEGMLPAFPNQTRYWAPTCSYFILSRQEQGPNTISAQCFEFDILSVKGPSPGTVLVQSSDINERMRGRWRYNVSALDLVTGGKTLLEKGVNGTSGWGVDAQGNVRLRVDRVAGRLVFFVRPPGATEWAEAGSASIKPWSRSDDVANEFQVAAFGENPNEVYLNYSENGRNVIGLYDLVQKKLVRTIFSDPKFDVDDLIVDSSGRAIGGNINRWVPEQEFFTPEWRKVQAELKASFPAADVTIKSFSQDGKKLIVFYEGPDNPGGTYFYVDLDKGDGYGIARRYPGITREMTGKTSIISYKARDGLTIDAYLTVPPNGANKNAPLILMPHGGPHARDDGGFDMWADFLANRGYVVLRPQFRGSRGFGDALLEAGRFQWGLKMQDDLSDGLQHLVAQGIADPKRVCIFGWSYGGYAAMAGATLTPELYRCVVAGAGVSDLILMLRHEAMGDSSNLGAQFWRKTIGNVADDFKKLQATSPARMAERAVAPMLLIHGNHDYVVPGEQSDFMMKAMMAAGKPVEMVTLEKEDHNLSNELTRLEMLKALESFLLKHNPPN